MDALFLILQDEEVNRFLPWYPVKTMDEAKQFLRETIRADLCPAPRVCPMRSVLKSATPQLAT